MRILGIDYGEKRIGLALTDEFSIIAHPIEPVARDGTELKEINRLVEQNKVAKIIVGLPLNLDGTAGIAAGKVQEFAEKLKEEVKLPVEFWDERMTTKEVEKMLIEFDISRKKRRDIRDSLCACVVLRTYLEANRSSYFLILSSSARCSLLT